jgi:hypothetical protein
VHKTEDALEEAWLPCRIFHDSVVSVRGSVTFAKDRRPNPDVC